METFYIVIVVILFVLAISDLVVGVSNDAVNFLNSAIGSKAAPFWIIMVIASLGIIFGATFSSGMMEVARKGIFHPDMFLFEEIMLIFLAVMLTDVILLDAFNTLGMPTSTTVSIVFELLGAAVAISLIKLSANTGGIENLGDYINSDKALAIISGILLSVFIAFIVGAVVQSITRLIFTFKYEDKSSIYGAIWGGIAITAITYFILIKGAKGASFMSDANKDWIHDNALYIIGFSFVGWTIIMLALKTLAKVNIFKMIILVGTFALAMAFAGNDLVNFIGVPLAGLKSFQEFSASGRAADVFTMEVLKESVQTPTLYLLIAGLVMVVTLWFSKKARKVTQTEINLSRQDEGQERFGSSLIARWLVRAFVNFSKTINSVLPESTRMKFARRLYKPNTVVSTPRQKQDSEDAPAAFDLMRASVNLVVASILISIGTSLKLPLSTTYVTFTVAMGTSLADGAWGRDSAVYRITGVLSVIGGWFITAIVAFGASFIFAYLLHLGGIFAIILLIGIALFTIVRTQIYYRKSESKIEQSKLQSAKAISIQERCTINILDVLSPLTAMFEKTINALHAEDRSALKKLLKQTEKLNVQTKDYKSSMSEIINELNIENSDTGHYYVQIVDKIREIVHSTRYIITPAYEHINNNHKGLDKKQLSEMNLLANEYKIFSENILRLLKNNDFKQLDNIFNLQDNLIENIHAAQKNQLKRIKKKADSTRKSMLYLNILSELKNTVLQATSLLKSHRDFILAYE